VRAEMGADAFSHENQDGVEFGVLSKRIHRLLFEHEVETIEEVSA
jgi:hypothetical protein